MSDDPSPFSSSCMQWVQSLIGWVSPIMSEFKLPLVSFQYHILCSWPLYCTCVAISSGNGLALAGQRLPTRFCRQDLGKSQLLNLLGAVLHCQKYIYMNGDCHGMNFVHWILRVIWWFSCKDDYELSVSGSFWYIVGNIIDPLSEKGYFLPICLSVCHPSSFSNSLSPSIFLFIHLFYMANHLKWL